jgi:hypothetical protein
VKFTNPVGATVAIGETAVSLTVTVHEASAPRGSVPGEHERAVVVVSPAPVVVRLEPTGDACRLSPPEYPEPDVNLTSTER